MKNIIRWIDADGLGANMHLKNPSWRDVENAFQRLDGYEFTELSLMMEECSGLNVAGGYQNRYFCQVISSSGTSALTWSGIEDSEAIPIMRDGQADFPRLMVVDKELALSAIKYFFLNGSHNPS